MYYYLSLGSNIEPKTNAVSMLTALIKNYGAITSYPFYRTKPEKIISEYPFLNSLAVIRTELDREQLKNELNQIETSLGRDRNDPQKSIKDRSADIDILGSSATFNSEFYKAYDEPYINLELLAHEKKVSLERYGLPTTEGATTIDLDATTGNIRIIDSAFDRQENRFKTAL